MIDEPTTAVILAGGELVSHDVIDDLPPEAYVVAADSGLDLALHLQIDVDLLVGDMDSVSAAALAAYREVPIEMHPTDKDQTDLELAIRAACRMDVERLIVVGGSGGDFSHHLANALLLASPDFNQFDIEWLNGHERMHIVHGPTRLHGSPGKRLTLLPVHGPAVNIRTSGLRWNLNGETLAVGSTRGVSNKFLEPVAEVSLDSGTLIAIMDPE